VTKDKTLDIGRRYTVYATWIRDQFTFEITLSRDYRTIPSDDVDSTTANELKYYIRLLGEIHERVGFQYHAGANSTSGRPGFVDIDRRDGGSEGSNHEGSDLVEVAYHTDDSENCDEDTSSADSSTGDLSDSEIQTVKACAVPLTVSIDLIMAWIDNCYSKHPPCRGTMDQMEASQFPSRVIDTHRKCIIPFAGDGPYAAMSYVWGKSNQLRLLSSNFDALHRQGGLLCQAEALSRTISDAISLCELLGDRCRYLWVDALCIVQDDDKMDQIKHMNLIYSQSSFVLIAACGDDSSAGLVPWTGSRETSQHIEMIGNQRFVSTLTPKVVRQQIRTSKWATRGWTLQEYALASRALIFGDTHVFFRCRQGLYCEDTGCQDNNDLGALDEELSRVDVAQYGSRGNIRHFGPSFSRLLREFIYRKLTDSDDTINAFLGILIHLFDDENSTTPFLWGLPSKPIGASLQWHAGDFWQRRPCFPSWSWAGWKYSGSNRNTFSINDDVGHDQSPLTCYCLSQDGNETLQLLDVACPIFRGRCEGSSRKEEFQNLYYNPTPRKQAEVPRGPRAIMERRRQRELERHLVYAPKPSSPEFLEYQLGYLYSHFQPSGPSEVERFLEDFRKTVSLPGAIKPDPTHFLFFWTSHAFLRVDRSADIEKGESLFQVYSADGQSVGHLLLDSEWRREQPDMLDFIVTTYTPKSYSDDDGVAVNALLVRPIKHLKGCVYYERVQYGLNFIPPRAWRNANPTRKLIALG
jgi:hypothetical protein